MTDTARTAARTAAPRPDLVRTATARTVALALGLAGLVAITPVVGPAGDPAARTAASAAHGTVVHNPGEAAREGRSAHHGVVAPSRAPDRQPQEASHAAKVVRAASASTVAGQARPADRAGAARTARTPSR